MQILIGIGTSKEPVKLDPGLAVLKMLMIFRYIVLNLFVFFPVFLIFHNTVMIYNTRNWSNDTAESQKKTTCFNAHFQYSQSKIMGLNKMWSLKSLAMLKCESRTSLHVVKYK